MQWELLWKGPPTSMTYTNWGWAMTCLLFPWTEWIRSKWPRQLMRPSKEPEEETDLPFWTSELTDTEGIQCPMLNPTEPRKKLKNTKMKTLFFWFSTRL